MNQQSIEDAIVKLDALILRDDAVENDFQVWLEENPVVFQMLNYRRFLSHPHLRTIERSVFIPDFMALRVDGLWDIVEIKRADTRVLIDRERRSTFYASMETYISQCADYSEYFDQDAYRQAFASQYGDEIQKRPKSLLIAGRSPQLDRKKVDNILGNRLPSITHQTYDDLRDTLEQKRVRLFGNKEDVDGLSCHFVGCIAKPLVERKTYIFDLGDNLEKDRVSIYVDAKGNLILRVTDALGLTHQVDAIQSQKGFQYDQAIYINIEIATTSDTWFITLRVNGVIYGVSQAARNDLNLDINKPFVIGTDISKTELSSLDAVEMLIYNRSLKFEDRQQLFRYFYGKYSDYFLDVIKHPTLVQFRGNQFMLSNEKLANRGGN